MLCGEEQTTPASNTSFNNIVAVVPMLTEVLTLIKVELVAIPDPILERNAIVHVGPLNYPSGNSDGLW